MAIKALRGLRPANSTTVSLSLLAFILLAVIQVVMLISNQSDHVRVGDINVAACRVETTYELCAEHPLALRRAYTCTAVIYLAIIAFPAIWIPPRNAKAPNRELDQTRAITFALVTLLPPIYFYLEAVVLYQDFAGKDEFYRLAADSASKVWAAFSILLGWYWFKSE